MSVGWGQDCVEGVEVELWGWCYNIEETTSLNPSSSLVHCPHPTLIKEENINKRMVFL